MCKTLLFSVALLLSPACFPADSGGLGRTDVRGILKDVFLDPTNPQYLFFCLQSSNESYYTTFKTTNAQTRAFVSSSVGAEIGLRGNLVEVDPLHVRPFTAREFQIKSPEDIVVLDPPPADAFACPDCASLFHKTPDQISRQGPHSIRGVVLAAWDGDAVLIRADAGHIVEASLRTPGLPRCGEKVEVAGLPETTLYNLRLNRAIWRPVSLPDMRTSPPLATCAREIVSDAAGRPRMDIRLHGQALRVRGIVRSLPRPDSTDHALYLEDGGYIVPVNADAARASLEGLQIGCTVEATGICVMDVDTWRPNAVYPRIRGYKLITRSPADIRILSYPPWLTPMRTLVIFSVLLAVIVGTLLWNRSLRTRSELRGRQLARELLLRLESELKTSERTRLAVELHDSIAQNLTGVSMEIDTALRSDEPLPEGAARHMGRALRTIDSCRGELRNCLWDLRNRALEEKDMNEAIRLTLRPTIGKADLHVRFNVPRARFTDNTAHAILRIIRELAANAVRHGKATEIWVAGGIDNAVLMFSVRDNGCGFDPDACPGILDGHFGLQGVRERVASLEGDIRFESAPGEGTRVSVSVGVPAAEGGKRF